MLNACKSDNLCVFSIFDITIKGRVHCFSTQIVMNKCYLLNPEKKFGADPSCHFRKKRTLISKNVVTEPKARRLSYSNNQLKSY